MISRMNSLTCFFLALVLGCTVARNVDEVIGCTRGRLNSGSYLYSHDGYCDMFYECDLALKPHEKVCGLGTLYDTNIGQCTFVESASNHYCNCAAAKTFPSVCCDQYYRCNGNDSLDLVTCPSGQVYSARDNSCVKESVTTTCKDYKTFCFRNHATSAPVATKDPCLERLDNYMAKASDDNVCHYNIISPYNRNTFLAVNMLCAEGTGFDPKVCRCVVMDKCSHQHLRVAKTLDTKCGASMQLTFVNGSSKFVEYKSRPGVATPKNVYLDRSSVSVEDNVAVFCPDSYLYMPYYAGNEMRQPLAIAISFRVTGNDTQGQQKFTVIRNERENHCQGKATLDVSATVQGSDLRLQIRATGKNEGGVESSSKSSGSVRLSNGGQGFVKLVLTFRNNTLSGLLYADQTSAPVEITAPGPIGTHIVTTECGFEIGRGLEGEVKEVSFYEGCGDFDEVDTTP